MIQKTIKIRSIGMLDISKAVPLHPVTIIYGENGCGKSTFAGILRSLTTGDPRPIRAKRRLNATDEPYASFLIEGGSGLTTFDGNEWNHSGPEIEVFDREFINRNVHVGPKIEHKHKRSLHQFVIGDEGVQLNNKVEQLTRDIASLNQEIRELELKIQGETCGDMAADEIARLPQDPDIEDRIASQKQALRAAQEASQIAKQSEFDEVKLQILDIDALRALLNRSLADVSKNAAERTQQHIQAHLDQHGESWLSDGIRYLDGSKCPFCGEDLTGNKLIEAYQEYFSDEYQRHRNEIESSGTAFERQFSEADLSRVTHVLDRNTHLSTFWTRFGVTTPEGAPDPTEIERLYISLRSALHKEIDRKRSAPLDELDVRDETLRLVDELQRLTKQAGAYNEAVREANDAIHQVKRDAQASDEVSEKRKLNQLLDQRDRYQEPLQSLCTKYLAKVAEKEQKTAEKSRERQRLKEYTEDWFTRYEGQTNRHLASSGCGFRLKETKTQYLGGGNPRVDYVLVIHGTEVVPTPSKSADPEDPHFGNTLSEGDKSSLAFGFFLAKLDLDSNIADKIVVFDDPMTSLDRNRRQYTIEQILGVADRCKQVIVLTHDLSFAWELWKKADPSQRESLQLDRVGADRSILVAWDIDDAVRDGYFADYDRLRRFYDGVGNDSRLLVVRSIRPVLEEYYRRRFAGDVARSDTLGMIAQKIREADTPSPLVAAKDEYTTLDSINEYVTRYEHARDSQSAQTDISHGELRAYVEKTLALIHGVRLAND